MMSQGVKRKLRAVLSADVKEHSRLMSQDEVGTIRTLNVDKEALKVIFSSQIPRNYMVLIRSYY